MSAFELVERAVMAEVAHLKYEISRLTTLAANNNADADMYANAWCRELQGYNGLIRNKRHHIDAMVLTTREFVEKLKAAEATMQKWRTIDTAPRDGTLIMLGRSADADTERDAVAAPGRWHVGYGDAPDDMGHDGGFMDDGFHGIFTCPRSFGNPDCRTLGYQPTHWMPLPPPPEV